MKLRPINLDELARSREQGAHAIFGPSGSGMYLNCVGSLVPNLLAGDTAGEDAATGTVAHGVAETWLRKGKRPSHLIGTNQFIEAGEWGFLIWIDEVMLDYVQMYVDWVDLLPGDHYVEQRVDISRLTPIPRQFGSADFIAIDRKRMVVADLKYGKGVMVHAEWNSQGMLYALGALFEHDKAFDGTYDIREIEIRIAQPRLDHFDSWVISREDLLAWGEWAKERMAQAWTLDAPRTAGAKQCQFCRVASSCAANAKMVIEFSEGVFGDVTAPVTPAEMQEFKDRVDDLDFDINPIEVATLTTSQLATMRPFRRIAEKWWADMDAELFRRAQAGEHLEQYGLKVVESRSRRVFSDEKRAVKKLTSLGVHYDEIVVEKVVSPAQSEKLLRKAGHRNKDIPSLLEGLTTKPPGKPTLAPLSDKRDAIVDLSEAVFGDTTNPETEDESEF